MKNVLFSLAVVGLAMMGCDGGGPHCEPIPEPMTCDEECTLPEVCNTLTGQCIEFMVCDPTCEADELCNFETGDCEANPNFCEGGCESGEYCDGGSCRDIPECDPECEDDEFCTN